MARKKGKTESFISGLIMTVGFGIVWYVTRQWWWCFPFFFAGVLPMAEGLRAMLAQRIQTKERPEQERALAEKQILLLAKQEKGRITPAMVALHTDLSTDRAEKVLEEMAKRGYATMEVTDDGRVEFAFPEFQPRIDDVDRP